MTEIVSSNKRAEATDTTRSGTVDKGLGQADNTDRNVERRILQSIEKSFPKYMRGKAKRLFIFMKRFGEHVFTITKRGKVYIRDTLLSSNILDFLYSSVCKSARKPSDYSTFRDGLLEIGAPGDYDEARPSQIGKMTGPKFRKWQHY